MVVHYHNKKEDKFETINQEKFSKSYLGKLFLKNPEKLFLCFANLPDMSKLNKITSILAPFKSILSFKTFQPDKSMTAKEVWELFRKYNCDNKAKVLKITNKSDKEEYMFIVGSNLSEFIEKLNKKLNDGCINGNLKMYIDKVTKEYKLDGVINNKEIHLKAISYEQLLNQLDKLYNIKK